jgi:hypothetical protein
MALRFRARSSLSAHSLALGGFESGKCRVRRWLLPKRGSTPVKLRTHLLRRCVLQPEKRYCLITFAPPTFLAATEPFGLRNARAWSRMFRNDRRSRWQLDMHRVIRTPDLSCLASPLFIHQRDPLARFEPGCNACLHVLRRLASTRKFNLMADCYARALI